MASKKVDYDNIIWQILLIAFIVLLADQFTKILIRSYVPEGASAFSGVVSITHSENSGVAFSMLQGMQWLSITFSIIAIACIIIFFKQYNTVLKRIGIGLLLGGIVGNLIDRLFIGTVTDFIDLHFWPVFNIADSAIVAGVILLVVSFWKE